MKICAAIKNDNVDFTTMRQSCINKISEKKQITKDYEQHDLNFVKTKTISLYT